jgi:hypothetical protein
MQGYTEQREPAVRRRGRGIARYAGCPVNWQTNKKQRFKKQRLGSKSAAFHIFFHKLP